MRYGFHRFGVGVGHGVGGVHVLGVIAMVAFWAAIVIGIVLLVTWLLRHRHEHLVVHGAGVAGAETPLDILQRRYAGGEIDKAEYEEKKKDLST